MKLLLSGVAAAILMTSPASAFRDSDQQDEDKIVCKREKGAELGSNLRKRKKTCMLESEWRELDRLNEQAKRRIMEKGNGKLPEVGGFGTGGG